ncbi:MAG: hypothetical protein KBD47_02320 [Candidatus Pacebacteria bacterium]|nr:hypothetical protein [Candidatus Paceibacterota bacterium]
MQPVSPVPPQPAPIQPAPTMMPSLPQEHKHWGPIIGVIVILALLVVAAVYIWGQKLNNDAEQTPVTPAPVSQTPSTSQSAAVSEPVDDFTNIEADLDASVSGLDDSNF